MELPDYMSMEGDTLKVRVSDWRGEKEIKVGMEEVADYYLHEAHNISSGCRTLAGHTGDWRPIDNLASECMYVYRELDLDKFRKVCMDKGLTPKF